MNKGFADLLDHHALRYTEHHGRINTGTSRIGPARYIPQCDSVGVTIVVTPYSKYARTGTDTFFTVKRVTVVVGGSSG
jgi:hypothetical protein